MCMPKLEKISVMPGVVIGRWTVLDDCICTEQGNRKWLCQCACGTKRYVLERSLKHGGSYSCGCFRKEQLRKAISADLTGKVFGDLTVQCVAKNQRKNGGVWWTCLCNCGKMCDYPSTLLINGKRTHCGCKTDRGRPVDITGKQFHRLTAEYMLPERDQNGNAMWHCRCKCGNTADLSYNHLVYCNVKSCGCQKKEHDKQLATFLTHVAGTSVDILKSKKVPSHNTTGYKGVYWVRGKYIAKIVFQRKQYFLGNYDDIEEAARARKEAEKVLFDDVAEHYQKWKERADKDPAWAEENPVQVYVERTNHDLNVVLLPKLS